MFQGDEEKVLGTLWNFKTDKFHFRIRPDLLQLVDRANEEPVKMTKRMILIQVTRIFDPIGFAAAFVIRAKIGLQQLWPIGTRLGRQGATHSSG